MPPRWKEWTSDLLSPRAVAECRVNFGVAQAETQETLVVIARAQNTLRGKTNDSRESSWPPEAQYCLGWRRTPHSARVAWERAPVQHLPGGGVCSIHMNIASTARPSAPCSRGRKNLVLLSSSMCTSILHPTQCSLHPASCILSFSHLPPRPAPALLVCTLPCNTQTPSQMGVEIVTLSLNPGQALNSDLSLLYSHLSFLTIEKLPIQEGKSGPWYGICVCSLPWDSTGDTSSARLTRIVLPSFALWCSSLTFMRQLSFTCFLDRGHEHLPVMYPMALDFFMCFVAVGLGLAF